MSEAAFVQRLLMEAAGRIEKCHARAKYCRTKANSARVKGNKEEFLRLAEQWETLANEIDQVEQMHAFGKR